MSEVGQTEFGFEISKMLSVTQTEASFRQLASVSRWPTPERLSIFVG